MTWRPYPLPPVPEATAAAVKAAFPKGTLYIELRTELGAIYHDGAYTEYEPAGAFVQEYTVWK
jgi:transposase